MRKPTPKMIEALVDLFGHQGTADLSVNYTAATRVGLIDRGLIVGKMIDSVHRLTDAGLAFLVDTRRAVVTADGTWVCANREPMSADQVTAELIRFESDRAIEAETLAKADAIRAAQTTPEFPPGLRLRNPQTGASFEVIEHTHAVRMRNLRTDAVSAVPQDMAREFEIDTDQEDTCRTEASERVSTGLIDATAMMLTEGRGSAITNLPNGSHAWTPVDRESEFDQAARRSPESAWERPAAGHLADAAGALFPDAATPAKLGETTADVVSDMMKLLTGQITAAEYYAPKPSNPPVTGFLPSLNAALTPDEERLLNDAPASIPEDGHFLAAGSGYTVRALDLLVSRGLAYRATDRRSTHYYLTAAGAQLVKYRRVVAAAKGSALDLARFADHGDVIEPSPDSVARNDAAIVRIDDRQHAADLAKATGATAVTVEQVRDGVVVGSDTANGPVSVAVDLGAYIAVRLTITRLRRGLTLSSADRVALADLLDTVRRSVVDLDRTAGDSGMHARRKGLEFDRIERTYRAHFGDTR